MNKAETITYAIRKECSRDSLVEWCKTWGITIDEFIKFLELGRKAFDLKTEWISCDDKVPIVSGEFLVTLTDADGEWVSTAEWNTTFGGRWQDIFPDDGYRDISNVIAWMPLPAPYQGEGEEE